MNSNNIKKDAKDKINNLTNKTLNEVKNIKVNNQKIYELALADTKLVLNTAEHAFIVAGIVNLSISLGSTILLLLGGVVIVKTLLHAKSSNDEIIKLKKLYK